MNACTFHESPQQQFDRLSFCLISTIHYKGLTKQPLQQLTKFPQINLCQAIHKGPNKQPLLNNTQRFNQATSPKQHNKVSLSNFYQARDPLSNPYLTMELFPRH